MTFKLVRLEVLRNVQTRLIVKYGGLQGVRDAGDLKSAIARPSARLIAGEVDTASELGAALAWSIFRNQPFVDGNKRAAFAALTIFLDINGFALTCSEVEETAMVLRAAASEISEAEWTAWVARSVGPVRAEPSFL